MSTLVTPGVCLQLLRSSLVNNRTQAKVAEELGMQEFAITNDKTKRPVALRTKTLADLLECTSEPEPEQYRTRTEQYRTVQNQNSIEPEQYRTVQNQNRTRTVTV